MFEFNLCFSCIYRGKCFGTTCADYIKGDPISGVVELTADPAPAGFPGDLRDWFAGQALAGLASQAEQVTRDNTTRFTGGTLWAMTRDAYDLARAMLAAREEAGRG